MKLFNDIKQSDRIKGNILSIWILCVSIVPNIFMSIMGNFSLLSRCVNVLFPLFLYCFIIAKIKKSGIIAAVMFPVMFLSTFQMVLDYLYGSSVISVDMWLNLATTNSSEVFELLDNIIGALAFVFLLYLPPVVAGIFALIHKWAITEKLSKSLNKISLICGIITVPMFVALFTTGSYNILNEMFPLNAISNLAEAFNRQEQMYDYKESSAGFRFNSICEDNSSQRYVSIVVIGETSRAANWSLFGYDKKTTTTLDSLKGVIGFGKALSQSNTTHKSVPLLLSHLDATTFGDSINHIKGLIAAFKEAGFSTTYLSTQQRNNSYIDFFGEEADKCIFLSDTLTSQNKIKDSDMLGSISSEIKNGAKRQLIVVHTYGSHFNYLDRYTDRSRRFKPDKYVDADKQYRKELVNAYDNTIVETDIFLGSIIKDLIDNGIYATLIYTSDHGEDIFDDDRNRFLHASPTPTYYQQHVPLVVWMSPEYLSANADKYENAVRNSGKFVSSSSSFFHTILDLANIQCSRYDDKLSLTSDSYHSPKLLFIDDHNHAIPLNKSGLKQEDISKLKEIGIY